MASVEFPLDRPVWFARDSALEPSARIAESKAGLLSGGRPCSARASEGSCRGPRTDAAGLTGTTWPVTSQSNKWRIAASRCLTLGAASSRAPASHPPPAPQIPGLRGLGGWADHRRSDHRLVVGDGGPIDRRVRVLWLERTVLVDAADVPHGHGGGRLLPHTRRAYARAAEAAPSKRTRQCCSSMRWLI
jgi:hypothetical protein